MTKISASVEQFAHSPPLLCGHGTGTHKNSADGDSFLDVNWQKLAQSPRSGIINHVIFVYNYVS